MVFVCCLVWTEARLLCRMLLTGCSYGAAQRYHSYPMSNPLLHVAPVRTTCPFNYLRLFLDGLSKLNNTPTLAGMEMLGESSGFVWYLIRREGGGIPGVWIPRPSEQRPTNPSGRGERMMRQGMGMPLTSALRQACCPCPDSRKLLIEGMILTWWPSGEELGKQTSTLLRHLQCCVRSR